MPTSRETLKDMFLYPTETPLKIKPYPHEQINHHKKFSIYIETAGGYGYWTTFHDLAIALLEATREIK